MKNEYSSSDDVFNFSELIAETESRIKSEYLPECIAWADGQFDNGWSNAMDRFDSSLVDFLRGNSNATILRREGNLYFKTITKYIENFKKQKGLVSIENFIDLLRV